MSISSIFQSIKRMFQPSVVPQAATVAPATTRKRTNRVRAPRQRQEWLNTEIDKIVGSGKYLVVPPKDMKLEVAQCRLTARLYSKFGSGKYKTVQIKPVHMIHVTIL